MGRRSRQRARQAGAVEPLAAPTADHRDAEGNVLTLRGSMSAATRREYAAVVAGSPLSREDAWQRAVEFLFERLAVRWTIAGVEPIERQRDLLARLRIASTDERAWVRDALRAHLAEHFPELQVP